MNEAQRAQGIPVDSDEHLALIVGPIVSEIYGDTAELGHYKLAIAVYRMAMQAAYATGRREER